MISINGMDYIKGIAELAASIMPEGVIFLICDGEKITWRKASNAFDLDKLHVGESLSNDGVFKKAFKECRRVEENVKRSVYGKRLKIICEPLVNDEGKCEGIFSIVIPLLHPVAKSFNDFAPILAEVFQEGAFIYMTDLNKIAYKQSSKKFDIPEWKAGLEIQEEDIAKKVIKTKHSQTIQLDSSSFGVPVLMTSCPLFQEDDPNEIVGTLGVVTPKILAGDLRNMSSTLEEDLSGISSAIEQLAASASLIHTNEQNLNKEVKEIINLSQEINKVSAFIKDIADETKMLGLNAAIEAARAGESGRGFGVVAEQIRKLSDQSKSTVPKIKSLTENIILKVEELSERSQDSLSSSEEQAAATEEMTASIQEITALSQELNKMAKDL